MADKFPWIPWKVEESTRYSHCLICGQGKMEGRRYGPKITHELRCINAACGWVGNTDTFAALLKKKWKMLEPAIQKWMEENPDHPPTKFVGYEQDTTETSVTAIIKKGKQE